MTPFYKQDGITIYCGNCLEVMPTLEPGFDAIITDPPYYNVIPNEWDRQWDSLSDFIEWLEVAVLQMKGLLKSNGSLYLFAGHKNCAYVQVMIDKHLTLLNNMVWVKTNGMVSSYTHNFNKYAPTTERILFYTPSLREYFRDYQAAIGLSLKEINRKLGHRKAEHAFYWNSTQWDLPTEETYEQLSRLPISKFQRMDYKDIKRTFHADKKTFDVLTGPTASNDGVLHPTAKPLWLMHRLIETSTNPGDLILDPFLGSGTTLEVCKNLGLRAIGIEEDEEYCEIAVNRLKQKSIFQVMKPEEVGVEGEQLGFDFEEKIP